MLERRRSRGGRPGNNRGRLKFVGFSTLLLLLVSGGTYFVWFSGVFDIREVVVEGAEFTDVSGIKGHAGANILFWQPSDEIESLPYVAEHTLEKDYIDRKVFVSLEERERDTIWCLERQEKCFWIDDDGFIFSDAPYPSGALVVKVVRDHSDRDLQLGDFALEEDMFVNLERVFYLIDEVNLAALELRIDELKYKEVTVLVSSGPDIYFSLAMDPAFGKSVIESLRESSEWSLMQYLDLRVENRAYYSL